MSSAHDAGQVPRDDAEAALAARHELGPQYEPAVVDSFVDRLDKVIGARIAEHVSREVTRPPAPPDRTGLTLAVVSIGCGIPLTAIAGGITGIPGILIVWVGIVLVNMAYALQQARRQGG
jgi:hypothetical protein